MADVVMKALKSFVVEIGDRELVVQIVRKTMNAVIRTQRQVVLKVAPEMVETVRARIAEFRLAYPTVESFDVVASHTFLTVVPDPQRAMAEMIDILQEDYEMPRSLIETMCSVISENGMPARR